MLKKERQRIWNRERRRQREMLASQISQGQGIQPNTGDTNTASSGVIISSPSPKRQNSKRWPGSPGHSTSPHPAQDNVLLPGKEITGLQVESHPPEADVEVSTTTAAEDGPEMIVRRKLDFGASGSSTAPALCGPDIATSSGKSPADSTTGEMWTTSVSSMLPEKADADSSTGSSSSTLNLRVVRRWAMWEEGSSTDEDWYEYVPVKHSRTSGRIIKPVERRLERAVVDASMKKRKRRLRRKSSQGGEEPSEDAVAHPTPPLLDRSLASKEESKDQVSSSIKPKKRVRAKKSRPVVDSEGKIAQGPAAQPPSPARKRIPKVNKISEKKSSDSPKQKPMRKIKSKKSSVALENPSQLEESCGVAKSQTFLTEPSASSSQQGSSNLAENETNYGDDEDDDDVGSYLNPASHMQNLQHNIPIPFPAVNIPLDTATSQNLYTDFQNVPTASAPFAASNNKIVTSITQEHDSSSQPHLSVAPPFSNSLNQFNTLSPYPSNPTLRVSSNTLPSQPSSSTSNLIHNEPILSRLASEAPLHPSGQTMLKNHTTCSTTTDYLATVTPVKSDMATPGSLPSTVVVTLPTSLNFVPQPGSSPADIACPPLQQQAQPWQPMQQTQFPFNKERSQQMVERMLSNLHNRHANGRRAQAPPAHSNQSPQPQAQFAHGPRSQPQLTQPGVSCSNTATSNLPFLAMLHPPPAHSNNTAHLQAASRHDPSCNLITGLNTPRAPGHLGSAVVNTMPQTSPFSRGVSAGTYPVSSAQPTGTYPAPSAGTYPVSSAQPTGTYPVSSAKPTGTYPVSSAQPTGTYPVSSAQPTGTYPVSSAKPTGTYPVSSAQPTGTYPVSSAQPTGTYPVSSAQPAGTYPFCPAPSAGTYPVSSAQHTGTYPAPSAGTYPVCPAPSAGTYPVSSAQPTGTYPVCSAQSTGTYPVQSPQFMPMPSPQVRNGQPTHFLNQPPGLTQTRYQTPLLRPGDQTPPNNVNDQGGSRQAKVRAPAQQQFQRMPHPQQLPRSQMAQRQPAPFLGMEGAQSKDMNQSMNMLRPQIKGNKKQNQQQHKQNQQSQKQTQNKQNQKSQIQRQHTQEQSKQQHIHASAQSPGGPPGQNFPLGSCGDQSTRNLTQNHFASHHSSNNRTVHSQAVRPSNPVRSSYLPERSSSQKIRLQGHETHAPPNTQIREAFSQQRMQAPLRASSNPRREGPCPNVNISRDGSILFTDRSIVPHHEEVARRNTAMRPPQGMVISTLNVTSTSPAPLTQHRNLTAQPSSQPQTVQAQSVRASARPACSLSSSSTPSKSQNVRASNASHRPLVPNVVNALTSSQHVQHRAPLTEQSIATHLDFPASASVPRAVFNLRPPTPGQDRDQPRASKEPAERHNSRSPGMCLPIQISHRAPRAAVEEAIQSSGMPGQTASRFPTYSAVPRPQRPAVPIGPSDVKPTRTSLLQALDLRHPSPTSLQASNVREPRLLHPAVLANQSAHQVQGQRPRMALADLKSQETVKRTASDAFMRPSTVKRVAMDYPLTNAQIKKEFVVSEANDVLSMRQESTHIGPPAKFTRQETQQKAKDPSLTHSSSSVQNKNAAASSEPAAKTAAASKVPEHIRIKQEHFESRSEALAAKATTSANVLLSTTTICSSVAITCTMTSSTSTVVSSLASLPAHIRIKQEHHQSLENSTPPEPSSAPLFTASIVTSHLSKSLPSPVANVLGPSASSQSHTSQAHQESRLSQGLPSDRRIRQEHHARASSDTVPKELPATSFSPGTVTMVSISNVVVSYPEKSSAMHQSHAVTTTAGGSKLPLHVRIKQEQHAQYTSDQESDLDQSEVPTVSSSTSGLSSLTVANHSMTASLLKTTSQETISATMGGNVPPHIRIKQEQHAQDTDNSNSATSTVVTPSMSTIMSATVVRSHPSASASIQKTSTEQASSIRPALAHNVRIKQEQHARGTAGLKGAASTVAVSSIPTLMSASVSNQSASVPLQKSNDHQTVSDRPTLPHQIRIKQEQHARDISNAESTMSAISNQPALVSSVTNESRHSVSISQQNSTIQKAVCVRPNLPHPVQVKQEHYAQQTCVTSTAVSLPTSVSAAVLVSSQQVAAASQQGKNDQAHGDNSARPNLPHHVRIKQEQHQTDQDELPSPTSGAAQTSTGQSPEPSQSVTDGPLTLSRAKAFLRTMTSQAYSGPIVQSSQSSHTSASVLPPPRNITEEHSAGAKASGGTDWVASKAVSVSGSDPSHKSKSLVQTILSSSNTNLTISPKENFVQESYRAVGAHGGISLQPVTGSTITSVSTQCTSTPNSVPTLPPTFTVPRMQTNLTSARSCDPIHIRIKKERIADQSNLSSISRSQVDSAAAVSTSSSIAAAVQKTLSQSPQSVHSSCITSQSTVSSFVTARGGQLFQQVRIKMEKNALILNKPAEPTRTAFDGQNSGPFLNDAVRQSVPPASSSDSNKDKQNHPDPSASSHYPATQYAVDLSMTRKDTADPESESEPCKTGSSVDTASKVPKQVASGAGSKRKSTNVADESPKKFKARQDLPLHIRIKVEHIMNEEETPDAEETDTTDEVHDTQDNSLPPLDSPTTWQVKTFSIGPSLQEMGAESNSPEKSAVKNKTWTFKSHVFTSGEETTATNSIALSSTSNSRSNTVDSDAQRSASATATHPPGNIPVFITAQERASDSSPSPEISNKESEVSSQASWPPVSESLGQATSSDPTVIEPILPVVKSLSSSGHVSLSLNESTTPNVLLLAPCNKKPASSAPGVVSTDSGFDKDTSLPGVTAQDPLTESPLLIVMPTCDAAEDSAIQFRDLLNAAVSQGVGDMPIALVSTQDSTDQPEPVVSPNAILRIVDSQDPSVRDLLSQASGTPSRPASTNAPVRVGHLQTTSSRPVLDEGVPMGQTLTQVHNIRFVVPQDTETEDPLTQQTIVRSVPILDTITRSVLTQDTSARPEFTQHTSTRPLLTQDTSTRPELTPDTSTRPELTQDTSTTPLLTQDTSTRPELAQHTSTRPELTQHTSNRPELTQDTSTRPLLTQDTSTRPLLTQDTSTRPLLTQDTSTIPLLTQDTSTRPLLTQDTSTRPLLTQYAVVIGTPTVLRKEAVPQSDIGSTCVSPPEVQPWPVEQRGISSRDQEELPARPVDQQKEYAVVVGIPPVHGNDSLTESHVASDCFSPVEVQPWPVLQQVTAVRSRESPHRPNVVLAQASDYPGSTENQHIEAYEAAEVAQASTVKSILQAYGLSDEHFALSPTQPLTSDQTKVGSTVLTHSAPMATGDRLVQGFPNSEDQRPAVETLDIARAHGIDIAGSPRSTPRPACSTSENDYQESVSRLGMGSDHADRTEVEPAIIPTTPSAAREIVTDVCAVTPQTAGSPKTTDEPNVQVVVAQSLSVQETLTIKTDKDGSSTSEINARASQNLSNSEVRQNPCTTTSTVQLDIPSTSAVVKRDIGATAASAANTTTLSTENLSKPLVPQSQVIASSLHSTLATATDEPNVQDVVAQSLSVQETLTIKTDKDGSSTSGINARASQNLSSSETRQNPCTSASTVQLDNPSSSAVVKRDISATAASAANITTTLSTENLSKPLVPQFQVVASSLPTTLAPASIKSELSEPVTSAVTVVAGPQSSMFTSYCVVVAPHAQTSEIKTDIDGTSAGSTTDPAAPNYQVVVAPQNRTIKRDIDSTASATDSSVGGTAVLDNTGVTPQAAGNRPVASAIDLGLIKNDIDDTTGNTTRSGAEVISSKTVTDSLPQYDVVVTADAKTTCTPIALSAVKSDVDSQATATTASATPLEIPVAETGPMPSDEGKTTDSSVGGTSTGGTAELDSTGVTPQAAGNRPVGLGLVKNDMDDTTENTTRSGAEVITSKTVTDSLPQYDVVVTADAKTTCTPIALSAVKSDVDSQATATTASATPLQTAVAETGPMPSDEGKTTDSSVGGTAVLDSTEVTPQAAGNRPVASAIDLGLVKNDMDDTTGNTTRSGAEVISSKTVTDSLPQYDVVVSADAKTSPVQTSVAETGPMPSDEGISELSDVLGLNNTGYTVTVAQPGDQEQQMASIPAVAEVKKEIVLEVNLRRELIDLSQEEDSPAPPAVAADHDDDDGGTDSTNPVGDTAVVVLVGPDMPDKSPVVEGECRLAPQKTLDSDKPTVQDQMTEEVKSEGGLLYSIPASLREEVIDLSDEDDSVPAQMMPSLKETHTAAVENTTGKQTESNSAEEVLKSHLNQTEAKLEERIASVHFVSNDIIDVDNEEEDDKPEQGQGDQLQQQVQQQEQQKCSASLDPSAETSEGVTGQEVVTYLNSNTVIDLSDDEDDAPSAAACGTRNTEGDSGKAAELLEDDKNVICLDSPQGNSSSALSSEIANGNGTNEIKTGESNIHAVEADDDDDVIMVEDLCTGPTLNIVPVSKSEVENPGNTTSDSTLMTSVATRPELQTPHLERNAPRGSVPDEDVDTVSVASSELSLHAILVRNLKLSTV